MRVPSLYTKQVFNILGTVDTLGMYFTSHEAPEFKMLGRASCNPRNIAPPFNTVVCVCATMLLFRNTEWVKQDLWQEGDGKFSSSLSVM